MSGVTKYLLDTNIIADLFANKKNIIAVVGLHPNIIVSVISVAEYLSNNKLSNAQIKQFNKFCDRIRIVNFSLIEEPELINLTINLRKQYKMKLPDAIIAATTISYKATLVSGDSIFEKIKELKFIHIP